MSRNKNALEADLGKLKESAPHVEKQGVYLGLENTLSAKENMDILDKVGSDHVRVYYDIANSTKNGYDVPGEIETALSEKTEPRKTRKRRASDFSSRPPRGRATD